MPLLNGFFEKGLATARRLLDRPLVGQEKADEKYEYYVASKHYNLRLRRIRHAKSINFEAMVLFQLSVDANIDEDQRNAALQAAISKYFTCFQSGEAAPKLDPKDIYRHQPDLLESHKELRDLRDTYLNHPSSKNFKVTTLLTYSREGRFQDCVPMFLRTNPLSPKIVDQVGALIAQLEFELAFRLAKQIDKIAFELSKKEKPDGDGPVELTQFFETFFSE